MRIVAARVTPVRLPLCRPLVTAHGEIAVRSGALLELEDETGHRGSGEALPLPGFGLESAEQALLALTRLAQEAVDAPEQGLDARLDEATRSQPDAASARGAFDVALHDLAARRDGLPLAAWLAKRHDGRARERVASGRLLAATRPEAAADEARRAVAEGFCTLKLKLGDAPFAVDRARVEAVRSAVGAEVALRLDANGAWSEPEAIERVTALGGLGVELLEQPVPAGALAALARVRAASPFPIAADEAVADEASARRVLAAGAADVLVLKPAALGGLRASARIAAAARVAGVAVVVTSFLDSAVGVSAALHLAASLPEPAPAAGLATGDLLAEDLAAAPEVVRGVLHVPARAGLGCRPDPGRLARLACGGTHELHR